MSATNYSSPTEAISSCPACGLADGNQAVIHHPALPLARCSRCGLVYTCTQAADISSVYVQTYYTHQPIRWTPGRGQMLRALALHRFCGYPLPGNLAERIPRGLIATASLVLTPIKGYWRTIPPAIPAGVILDVGCGNGLYLARLCALGWSVHGLEPDAQAYAHVRGSLGLDVVCGTIENNPWPDNSFDVITFWHSLEHMARPVDALQAAYALLRPGGLLMMDVPNWDSLQRRIFGQYWFHLDLPRHLVHFSSHSLAFCLTAAGFSSIRVSAVPSAVGVTGSLERLLRRRQVGEPAGGSQPPPWRHNRLLKALVWPGEALLAPLGLAGCLTATARKR